MRTTLLALVAVTALTVVGMAAGEIQQAGPQHKADMSMMQNCPMKVPGTELSVANAVNGIVLTITTKTGDVAELRRRTESMARMHSSPSNHAGMHANMMPFSVKYEEIVAGARLTLTPKDPAQLDAFRTKVRQHAEQMKKGECSMMQGMMQGMMGGMRSEPTPKPEPKPKGEEEGHEGHHPPGEKK